MAQLCFQLALDARVSFFFFFFLFSSLLTGVFLRSVDSTGAYYVNLMHDRKPVQMGECALNCPWDSFVDMVGQSFISNRNQRCQAAPKGVDTTFAEDPEVGFLC